MFEFIFILLAMSYSLRVTSYNCRNLKSSIDNVRQLCDTHDIIFSIVYLRNRVFPGEYHN